MVYEDFLACVQDRVTKCLGLDCSVVIRQVPKNNGIQLDGLCISRQNERLAPTIYLNSYYEQYQEQQMDLDEIVEDIVQLYHENLSFPPLDTSQFLDFKNLAGRISYKLVNSAYNEDYLKQIPHIPFLDLAIVFYLFIEETEKGQMTAVVDNSHLAMWNMTKEEIYEAAAANTPLLFPARIRNMTEILKEIARTNLGQDYREEVMDELFEASSGHPPLYVLTNSYSLNGAACMLYPDVLKAFSRQLQSDLILLPSSIHEVLLIPDSPDLNYGELQDMVLQINTSEVPAEDRLSNQIYHYSRQTDAVTLLPSQNSKLPS